MPYAQNLTADTAENKVDITLPSWNWHTYLLDTNNRKKTHGYM